MFNLLGVAENEGDGFEFPFERPYATSKALSIVVEFLTRRYNEPVDPSAMTEGKNLEMSAADEKWMQDKLQAKSKEIDWPLLANVANIAQELEMLSLSRLLMKKLATCVIKKSEAEIRSMFGIDPTKKWTRKDYRQVMEKYTQLKEPDDSPFWEGIPDGERLLLLLSDPAGKAAATS